MKSPVIAISLAALVGVAVTESCRADIVYVSNWNNSTIDEFDSSGTYLGVFANVQGPRGVAVDSSGNLYVAAYSSQQILRYTPAGVASVFTPFSGHAEGMAFDKSGNLFVADFGANTITKITPG